MYTQRTQADPPMQHAAPDAGESEPAADVGEAHALPTLAPDRLDGNGAAAAPVFQRVSTRAVAPDCSFDYWQSHFFSVRQDRPRALGAGGFHGELLHTTPWQGVTFMQFGHDALSSQFGGSDPDGIVLLCIPRGAVYIRHDRDSITPLSARTGLVLFDQDQSLSTIESQPVTMIALMVPRALVGKALGAPPIPAHAAVRPFAHPGPLVSGLLQHLGAMAEYGMRAQQRNAAAAVSIARSLAMTLLARRNPRRWSLPEAFDDALLEAARHMLDVHAGNPDLTAEQAAAMLGCSRAHLYRLFAGAGTTVADSLRETRLRRAGHLFESGSQLQIGEIAWLCGYTDWSAFDKAFRRHFGMTPRDFRHHVEPAQR